MEKQPEQQMNMESTVTRSQVTAVTMISLVALAAGVVIAALYGNFLMHPNDMKSQAGQAYFSQSIVGLPEAKATETVELKNGDSYDMTAGYVKKNINGVDYQMMAYNGSIPGPLIKVAQGSEVTINFKNNTDMKTLLHSHGVRMDNAFDGSQTSQTEMQPGASFSYKLKFPDAGMYWYHPHVREDFQQELGLYGNFLVTPSSADYWSPVNREIPLFLDDILINNNQINLSSQGADHTLMGRYGNTMLINGQTNFQLSAKQGEVVRLYITNAANARPFNFAIPGVKMKLVGADGGAYEKDSWVDSVVISPSERAIVEVLFDSSGKFSMENIIPDRKYDLGLITIDNNPIETSYAKEFAELKTHPATIQSIDPLRSEFGKAPDKQLDLTLDMTGGMGKSGGHMMPDGSMMGGGMMMSDSPDGIEWDDTNQTMNQSSNTDSVKWKIVEHATGKENMDIDWTFKQGQPVKIRIFNDPKSMHPMQHPIHFHGQQFLVLSRNGVKETNLAWKDTVLVPAGQTIDILLYPTNPGTWMAHCHIAEHLEAGMMFKFKVN